MRTEQFTIGGHLVTATEMDHRITLEVAADDGIHFQMLDWEGKWASISAVATTGKAHDLPKLPAMPDSIYRALQEARARFTSN